MQPDLPASLPNQPADTDLSASDRNVEGVTIPAPAEQPGGVPAVAARAPTGADVEGPASSRPQLAAVAVSAADALHWFG